MLINQHFLSFLLLFSSSFFAGSIVLYRSHHISIDGEFMLEIVQVLFLHSACVCVCVCVCSFTNLLTLQKRSLLDRYSCRKISEC